MKIRTALVSVHDKSGVAEFAKGLKSMGVEILSTGGTAKALRDAGIEITDVSDYTGSPEIMDGRVKTLHPKVHGGILAVRDDAKHAEQAKQQGIRFIDLVCVNLYPFTKVTAKADVSIEEAIENIDIGGPSMVRSAAKNHKYVTVVTSPSDYQRVLDDMKRRDGDTNEVLRRELAVKAFSMTSVYDSAIAAYLGGREEFPELLTLQYQKLEDLRYGENPHQKGALYRALSQSGMSVAYAKFHGGKELSYNNLLDLDSAFELAKEFSEAAAVIVKHNNPCGAAVGANLAEAFGKALAGDPVSAYGGVLAVNRMVDLGTVEKITAKENFLEAIIAPGYAADAIKALREKPRWGKNLRILEAEEMTTRIARGQNLRGIRDGLLLQSPDEKSFQEIRTATVDATEDQKKNLMFAWVVCKHVRSNAIVLVRDGMVVGVGAGQMSRVDSCHMAVRKAGDRSKGSVAASDAFFPFPDGPELLMEAGIAAIIQPGGSIRDDEVFAAAKKRNVPMLLTGIRHFRH
jgi:phosphoribosylaminoimidazolecarboxamide formyltransferase/IMP cyclohydrolase